MGSKLLDKFPGIFSGQFNITAFHIAVLTGKPDVHGKLAMGSEVSKGDICGSPKSHRNVVHRGAGDAHQNLPASPNGKLVSRCGLFPRSNISVQVNGDRSLIAAKV